MYYIIMLILLWGAELFYFRIAATTGIVDCPNQRSSHVCTTLRGGGLVFYLGALGWFLTNGFLYPWFMAGLTLISLISFADDIRSVSQKVRLGVHLIAILLLFRQWDNFFLPGWVIFFCVVVCLGVINACNFMDGINGITGGYSLVTLIALVYIHLKIVPFAEIGFIYTLILADLVFLFFNFRSQARCFAGDVGSVSMAFILLFLIGALMVQTRDVTWIVLLAVYGVDTVLTLVHRILLRERILQPHRKHLYQLMANELKIPHLMVSLIYMGVQVVVTVGYLYARVSGYTYTYVIAAVFLLGLLYLWFMKKYFHLHRIS